MMAQGRLNEVHFDKLWPVVLNTVRSVISMSRYGHTDVPTWQTRFFDIYNLCSAIPNPYTEQMYEETKRFLEDHCTDMKNDITESGQNILTVYAKYWTEYKIGAEHLNRLYSHVNNQIAKVRYTDPDYNQFLDNDTEMNDPLHVEVGEMALKCWKRMIIDPLQERLRNTLVEQINLDRVGQCTNPTVIKVVVMSLVDVCQNRKINALEFYEKSFETTFLQATSDYYKEEGNRSLAKHDCIQYMKRAISLINDEDFRSRKFLNPTSYKKVSDECHQRLVCDHFDVLKNKCDELIHKEDFDALQNMYKLLKPTPIGVNYMAERLKDNISSIGREQVESLKGENLPIEFVEVLIALHNKYSNIVKDTFSNDSDFVSSLDQACAIVTNDKRRTSVQKRAPELLAQYFDGVLRKSSKAYNESDIEAKLAQGLTIFKYVEDKDYFQRFYQKMLARRLINQHSVSTDVEEFMINRLKCICGYEYTTKLNRMFQDIKISEDLNKKFCNSIKQDSQTQRLGLEFNAYILQANSWPVTQVISETFLIPEQLHTPLYLFETFYNKQYNGRKLCWIYHLSTNEIRMSYLDRSYFVTMNTYQTVILLAFNQEKHLTFNEIEVATNIVGKDLKKHLLPLIESKILVADSNELTTSTSISVNFEFKNKRTKFKISIINPKETESEAFQQTAEDDRKFYLQAIIVRIMKSRRILKHNILIEETIVHAKHRFLPSIPMIKKCIEILIDKQYLERNQSDEYKYIA